MTQKVWHHGSWAKVGDLVRVFNGYRQTVGVGIVVENCRKPLAGPLLHVALPDGKMWVKSHLVQVHRPDFDYDKESQNG